MRLEPFGPTLPEKTGVLHPSSLKWYRYLQTHRSSTFHQRARRKKQFDPCLAPTPSVIETPPASDSANHDRWADEEEEEEEEGGGGHRRRPCCLSASPHLAAFYTGNPYACRQLAARNDGAAPLVGEEELDPRAVDLATGSEAIFVPPCLFCMEDHYWNIQEVNGNDSPARDYV
jgi:hypothetical protein